MTQVRLYLVHDNRHWHIDIPRSSLLEKTADLSVDGIAVYHAATLHPPTKTRTPRITTKHLHYL